MNFNELRKEIDRIDGELIAKLEERFAVVTQIGEYKKAKGMGVLDPERECKKLESIEAKSSPELAEYNLDIFEAIMDASKELQQRIIDGEVLGDDGDDAGADA